MNWVGVGRIGTLPMGGNGSLWRNAVPPPVGQRRFCRYKWDVLETRQREEFSRE